VYDLNETGVTALPIAVYCRSRGSLAVHIKDFFDVTSEQLMLKMYLSFASARVGALVDFSSNQNCRTPGLFEENILISILDWIILYSRKVLPKRVANDAMEAEAIAIDDAMSPVAPAVESFVGVRGNQTSHVT
jgi:hypothetical protein